jgi:DNA-binding MarR family transcriptional regulator
MEVFLMAAISRGNLTTLYALKESAGLQPGSLAHVIKALIEAGLLERSESVKRGRRPMTLTENGDKFLADKWRKSLDANREMESVIRSTMVAILMGDIGEAVDFLYRSASTRPRHQGHQELDAVSPENSPIGYLAAMRSAYENDRNIMEVNLLHEFGARLSEVDRKRHAK